MFHRKKQSANSIATPEVETRRKAAYARGQAAFASGAMCASALDTEFITSLRGAGWDETVVLLDAWSAGWTAANLAAPIPGWSEAENEALRQCRSL